MSQLIEILAAGVVDGTGVALDSGRVYVYQAGTTTKANVYTDSDLTTPSTNPVVLDSAGRAEVYVDEVVRLVIEASDGDPIMDVARVGSDAIDTSTAVLSTQLTPIGSIIPFYDFNAAISFNSNYWAYCDGSTKNVGNVSRVLPDLSNRYLVGFGTEGAGDIDSASWATAAVGAASHQVDVSHTHTGPSHTHTGPSHTHDSAGLSAALTVGSGALSVNHVTASSWTADYQATGISGGAFSGSGTQAIDVMGTTAADGTGATGASGTGATGSGGSATQTIQPRSIRVRFIMRVA